GVACGELKPFLSNSDRATWPCKIAPGFFFKGGTLLSEPDSTAPLEELPVFVYGTLRSGQDNYARFLAGKNVRETPAALPDHSMYVAYGYPFVTDVLGGRSLIRHRHGLGS